MDELLGLMSQHNEVNDADVLFKMVFYLLVTIQTPDCQYLGARFIEECVYIDAFMHKDQIGMI